ncbi:MbcA/ParS/Xre antitoxin family protein [Oxalobacteraceae bacterium R-40]|uniref:MbcA/ParS/Xre antitoxin family protein n=1 Tax=Keguizhuia sedimenti TaxID=3064264 RepID=A0ABU1BN45_9BURK|nr:MbcA/ParS/Xre antitoxin family protein [Oxalobacteraceae bacterium R-40]
MDKDNLPERLEALHQHFQTHSRKAQAYYAVMHKARQIVGSDDAASAWMEKPLSALNGKTPSALVSEGRADDVLVYIDSLKPGSSV